MIPVLSASLALRRFHPRPGRPEKGRDCEFHARFGLELHLWLVEQKRPKESLNDALCRLLEERRAFGPAPSQGEEEPPAREERGAGASLELPKEAPFPEPPKEEAPRESACPLWEAVLPLVLEVMTKPTFDLWFGKAYAEDDGETLTVWVQTPYQAIEGGALGYDRVLAQATRQLGERRRVLLRAAPFPQEETPKEELLSPSLPGPAPKPVAKAQEIPPKEASLEEERQAELARLQKEEKKILGDIEKAGSFWHVNLAAQFVCARRVQLEEVYRQRARLLGESERRKEELHRARYEKSRARYAGKKRPGRPLSAFDLDARPITHRDVEKAERALRRKTPGKDGAG